jgi:hypothetical protein
MTNKTKNVLGALGGSGEAVGIFYFGGFIIISYYCAETRCGLEP